MLVTLIVFGVLVGVFAFWLIAVDPPKFRWFRKYEAAKRAWAAMCSSNSHRS